jgi:hypothetical protein
LKTTPPGVARFSGGVVYPFRVWGDIGFGVWAGAVEAGGFHGHEDTDLDVVVAERLAREAHLAEQVPLFEHL